MLLGLSCLEMTKELRIDPLDSVSHGVLPYTLTQMVPASLLSTEERCQC